MNRRRWFIHLIGRSLAHRKAGSLLLVLVLAMASSLVTSLAMVSLSMEKRISEEVRRYGANLVIVADRIGMDVGSGGMNFGVIAEPVSIDQRQAQLAIGALGRPVSFSADLRGTLQFQGKTVAVDGVDFTAVRRLFPWWRLTGTWPDRNGTVVGSDIARRYGVKPGDELTLTGGNGTLMVRVSGVVSTGGDEDGLIFIDLQALQQVLEMAGQVTTVRLLVPAAGQELRQVAANLQQRLNGVKVKEVRQVARTSESLLKKVQLLMVLVTLVVVIACGGSVAGTMSSSVLERGKEIGLMKAMGASKRDVVLIFAAESALLGLVGGIAGYGVGYGIADLVTRKVFSMPADFMPVFVPAAVAISCLLALFGSTGPMIAVYRLDPAASLRGE